MNYAKIVKIVPMLDSTNEAEMLAALRALQRALAPETFGDVARLIEAALPVEIEPPRVKPFTGFRAAAQPAPQPQAARTKPLKPFGDGWIWNEHAWNWQKVPYPPCSRFQTLKWVDPTWIIQQPDYEEVMRACVEVMNQKLSRIDKMRMEALFLAAMSKNNITTHDLLRLEQLEVQHRYNKRYTNV